MEEVRNSLVGEHFDSETFVFRYVAGGNVYLGIVEIEFFYESIINGLLCLNQLRNKYK